MERVLEPPISSEDTMKKALSLVLVLGLMLQLSSCSKKPRLDIANFEKYALEDLQIEKKDISTGDRNAYYDLDHTIDNTDETQAKRDHFVEVYSQTLGNTIGQLIVVYNDYQQKEDARSLYDQVVETEKRIAETDPNTFKYDQDDNSYLMLTSKDSMTYLFECMYIQDDVLVFFSIVLSSGELANLDADWLKRVEKFMDDLHIRTPFFLNANIEALLK